jgi:hypothetical protein
MTIVAISGFILLIVFIFAISTYFEKKRTKAIEAFARRIGFSFFLRAPAELEDKTARFKLFSCGHGRIFRNVVSQQNKGTVIYQFDYSYTVGSGKNSSTYRQTVTLFELNQLNIPDFIMGPESIFHKLGELFKIFDIDFPEYPEFSRKYLLKGGNEDAIRALFKDEILKFFTSNLDYNIEGSASLLLVYSENRRLSPEDMEEALKKRVEILNLFLKNTGKA